VQPEPRNERKRGIQIAPLDPQSPEGLRPFQQAEAKRWWPIIKASNLKAE
jgi:hypothetical protein